MRPDASAVYVNAIDDALMQYRLFDEYLKRYRFAPSRLEFEISYSLAPVIGPYDKTLIDCNPIVVTRSGYDVLAMYCPFNASHVFGIATAL